MQLRNTIPLMLAVLLAALVAASITHAAALSANRDTPARDGDYVAVLQGSNVIYAGCMVAMYSNGVAQAASDLSGLNVIGRAEDYSDNTGANYLATRKIQVRRGVFRWDDGNTITVAQIGDLCYALDDHTVKTTGITNYIIAGVIVDVDSDGVWVDTHDIGAQGAITAASMAIEGAATVGTTLGVAGAATFDANVNVGAVQTNTGAVKMLSTLGVTGVATFDATPKLTTVGTPGEVVANPLVTLPTGSTTNAAYLIVTVGATDYAIPMFAQP